jgi:RhtB (resistance to homoserine/threonine) family protein
MILSLVPKLELGNADVHLTFKYLNMFDSQVLAFTGIAALLTITPGADTMLVIRNVLSRGGRAGVFSTFGICSGLFIHASLSALGLSVILVKSATAFQIVKYVGAGYLIFLGIQSIWRMFQKGEGFSQFNQRDKRPEPNLGKKSLIEGFMSNILNPKVAVFYLAFLPQFINAGDPVFQKSILLASIHAIEGIIWLCFVSLFLDRIKAFFIKPKTRKVLEGISGTVLIGFGVKLSMEQL